jgi:hypothetical protein
MAPRIGGEGGEAAEKQHNNLVGNAAAHAALCRAVAIGAPLAACPVQDCKAAAINQEPAIAKACIEPNADRSASSSTLRPHQ